MAPSLERDASELSAPDISPSSKRPSKGKEGKNNNGKTQFTDNRKSTVFPGGRRSRTAVSALIPRCVPFSISLLYLELHLNPIMPPPPPLAARTTPPPPPSLFKTKHNRTKQNKSKRPERHCDATSVRLKSTGLEASSLLSDTSRREAASQSPVVPLAGTHR